jgi:hypothetical protein
MDKAFSSVGEHAARDQDRRGGVERGRVPPGGEREVPTVTRGDFTILAIVFLIVYFLPTIIAAAREHHNDGAIFALNLLLGWTFLGWVAALVWSLTSVMPPSQAQVSAVGQLRDLPQPQPPAEPKAEQFPLIAAGLAVVLAMAMLQWLYH